MRTVASLIEALSMFPADAKCSAYEGEGIGIVIQHETVSGWIDAGPEDAAETGVEIDRLVNGQWVRER